MPKQRVALLRLSGVGNSFASWWNITGRMQGIVSWLLKWWTTLFQTSSPWEALDLEKTEIRSRRACSLERGCRASWETYSFPQVASWRSKIITIGFLLYVPAPIGTRTIQGMGWNWTICLTRSLGNWLLIGPDITNIPSVPTIYFPPQIFFFGPGGHLPVPVWSILMSPRSNLSNFITKE